MIVNKKEAGILNGLLLIEAFALALVYSLRRMGDSDLWGHLKCGQYFFENHAILKTHYYNCSWPDFPYLNHEWLFQAIIYRIQISAGEVGLIALQVSLVMISFYVLYRIMKLYSDNILLIVFVLSLGILASSHRFLLRPQHFSYVFLIYTLFSLHMYQKGNRRYADFLPLIMFVWVNIHAESLWGVLIPGVFIAGEYIKKVLRKTYSNNLRRLCIVFGLVFIASLMNPFTYKTIIWPLIVMKEQFAGVEELLAPTTVKYLFFWIYFSLFIISNIVNFRNLDLSWMLLSIIFAVIAWTANRGVPHFVFVSSPFIVVNISDVMKRYDITMRLKSSLLNVTKLILLGLIAYILVIVVSSPLYLNKYDNVPYPEGALKFIEKNDIRGNIFNHHPWGNFIIWTSFPRLKPYIDGRFFFKKFYDEYYQILGGGIGWQSILSKYDISIALLPYNKNGNRNLNDSLFAALNWYLVYWDDQSLLYLKDTQDNRHVINDYGNRGLNPDRQLFEFKPRSRDVLVTAKMIAEKNLVNAQDSYKAFLVAANTAFLLSDFTTAAKRYKEVLKHIDHENAWVYYRLALSYRNLGNLKKTEEYLSKCLDLAPDFEEGKRMLQEVRLLLAG